MILIGLPFQTLKSVRSSGWVPESILKFVVPLGATVNMDGTAIYFPIACVWLAVLNGVEMNVVHYILLVFIATVGSAGTAPVPASGLVLIVTAYNTVFGTTGLPDGFSFVVAIDWFLDRCITVMNVTGDTVVCASIAQLCPIDEDVSDDDDAEKEGRVLQSTSVDDIDIESADSDADVDSDVVPAPTMNVKREASGGINAIGQGHSREFMVHAPSVRSTQSGLSG